MKYTVITEEGEKDFPGTPAGLTAATAAAQDFVDRRNAEKYAKVEVAKIVTDDGTLHAMVIQDTATDFVPPAPVKK